MSKLFPPTELLDLAKLHKWHILDVLLNGIGLFNLDINTKDDLGKALVHILVGKNLKLLDKAINKGANINLVNGEGKTILHLAAEDGNQRAVVLLIKAGADQSIKDAKGETAIFKAVANGYNEIVRHLIDGSKAYDPITSVNYHGCNLLHVGIEHVDTVKLLIASGIAVNHFNIDKLSPLQVAVAKGYYDATKLLITNGAYVDCFYDYGKRQSLLQHALEQQQDEIAKVLIEMGINVDYRNAQGETPLHLAITSQSFGILKLLLKSGACVNLTDEDGYAPLHLVAETQEVKFAQAILSKGGLINLQTLNGDSALHRAASLGNLPMLECLLNYENVDVNLVNNDGCTPLHLAADNGHTLLVDYLVNFGADICLLDNFERNFVVLCLKRKGVSKLGQPVRSVTFAKHVRKM